jgi:geranylgeranyl diphosphate synthase type II
LLELFEGYLLDNLPQSKSFHPTYQDALCKMLKAGGKRFRPMLLLTVVDSHSPLLVNSSLKPALALEFLHTYSLIHDDLPSMDNSPLRRGEATLHTVYDEALAILVGDALNSEAFGLIASSPLSSDIKIELISELSQNGGLNGMVLGQAIDLEFENKKLSLENLKFLHLHKTGKLIASSLKMGAIIAGFHKDYQNSLYDFGLDLGLLFQIQDDIIDETMDSKDAGKLTKNDDNKNSFVNLLTLEKAYQEADLLAEKIENKLKEFDDNLSQSLSNFLEQYLYRHRR